MCPCPFVRVCNVLKESPQERGRKLVFRSVHVHKHGNWKKVPKKGDENSRISVAFQLSLNNWKKVPKKGDENSTSSTSWRCSAVVLLKESPQERGRKRTAENRIATSKVQIERKSPRKGTKTLQGSSWVLLPCLLKKGLRERGRKRDRHVVHALTVVGIEKIPKRGDENVVVFPAFVGKLVSNWKKSPKKGTKTARIVVSLTADPIEKEAPRKGTKTLCTSSETGKCC